MRGWLTPDSDTEDTSMCRSLVSLSRFMPMVTGALDKLASPHSWETYGDMTPDECAEYMQGVIDSYLESAGVSLIGCILAYPSTAIPTWALLCDGAEYDRVEFPLLYAALADVYHVDADTFETPDMTDRFILGAGVADIGDTGGNAEITISTAQMPAHTHAEQVGITGVINGGLEAPAAPLVSSIPLPTGSTGGGNPVDITPPYHAQVYIIVAMDATGCACCPGPAEGMQLIASVNLDDDYASVEFENIPQDYRHLEIRATVRSTAGTNNQVLLGRVNDDGGNNYRSHNAYNYGTTLYQYTAGLTTDFCFGWSDGASSPGGQWGQFTILFHDYTGTARYKNMLGHSWASSNDEDIIAMSGGTWRDVDPIEKLLFFPGAGDFLEGSTIELWGVGNDE